jgi:hypothetical protein
MQVKIIQVPKSPILLEHGLMNVSYVGGQLLQLLRACHKGEDYNFLYNHASLYLYCLKGQCHEIFDPQFFSSNNPTWAPD